MIRQRIDITHLELDMKREDYEPIKNLPFGTRKVEAYTNARLKEYPDVAEEQVYTHDIFSMGIGDIKRAWHILWLDRVKQKIRPGQQRKAAGGPEAK